ncbi:MAG TPA: hypothetical protein VGO57_17810 [Verrucomicrobiae bacterium]
MFAVGVLIYPVHAGDQKVIFSVPADDDAVSSVNPDNTALSVQAANTYRAPAAALNMGSSPTIPMPSISANPNWQKAVDRRKNWMLMTPEEVMGVPTPEKMFGLPDKDQLLTPEQRFLKRQEDARADLSSSDANNSSSGFGSKSKDDNNPFGQNKSDSLFSRNNNDSDADSFAALKLASQSSAAGSDSSFGALRRISSPNSSDSFSGLVFPSTPKTDDSAQIADMERFRALLGSSQPANTSPINDPALTSAPVVDSKRPVSQFDALGHWTSGADNFNKLMTPATVAGLSGSVPKPAPVKRESWQPQLPPWLLTGPPTTPPTGPTLRKF